MFLFIFSTIAIFSGGLVKGGFVMNTKLKTILLWIAYIAVCLCAAAMPIAERGIRAKLIGKEERDEFDNTTYYRNHSYRRGI